MKNFFKISLFIMSLLAFEQSYTEHTIKNESQESWLYRNRYNIAGAVALGAGGTAAYVYQNEIADFIKSLTPQQAAEQIAVLENSIASDLKDVTKKEAIVENKEYKSEESVADMQADITQIQNTIAKEQNILKNLYNYWISKERLQEINPENKPVDSWGFYKSTPNSQLTPEEEQAGRDERRDERTQSDIDHATKNPYNPHKGQTNKPSNFMVSDRKEASFSLNLFSNQSPHNDKNQIANDIRADDNNEYFEDINDPKGVNNSYSHITFSNQEPQSRSQIAPDQRYRIDDASTGAIEKKEIKKATISENRYNSVYAQQDKLLNQKSENTTSRSQSDEPILNSKKDAWPSDLGYKIISQQPTGDYKTEDNGDYQIVSMQPTEDNEDDLPPLIPN